MSQDQDQANNIASIHLDIAELLAQAEHDVHYDVDESVTVSSTAKILTASKYGNRSEAFITVEVAAVRWWTGDTPPTATVGHLLNVGDVIKLHSALDIQNIKFIRKDGADATLRCSYGH
ncbi:hypothetical protein LCGC14_2475670 [marine sediment metagenome]|uniref:Uncharacterized protein n=1 Tax=marine sediment metagenome TaxID=412755 RepID=A0A0F9DL71_9ZZZZ